MDAGTPTVGPGAPARGFVSASPGEGAEHGTWRLAGRSGGPPGGRWIARLGAVVLLASIVVLAVAAPAFAHAELESSTPADGEIVAASPDSVVLSFSEGVSVEKDGVRVVDSAAERVDESDATATDNRVTVPLQPDLPDGSYVVSYRVVSADSHPVHAAFQFSVRSTSNLDEDLASKAFAGSSDRRDEVAGAVLRGLMYLGVLVACGAVLVGGFLRRGDEPTPVSKLVTAMAGVGLVAALLQVPVQASLATGRGWGSVAEAGLLGRTLADGLGVSLGLCALGLVGVMVTSGLPFVGTVRWVATCAAVVAPLALALSGHTRTMSPLVIGYLADGVHVLAGAIWLGGLVALAQTLAGRRRRDDVAGSAEAVSRFSGLAAIALAGVAVTGTAMGWIEVGGLSGLWSTTYGRLLLVKVAVVALVVAAGAWNRFRLVPALAGGSGTTIEGATPGEDTPEVVPDEQPSGPSAVGGVGETLDDPRWRTFGRIIRLEMVGLVLVVAVTGVLVNVVPAKVARPAGPETASAPFGDGTMEVIVDPARTGRNDIHVYVLDAGGRLVSKLTGAEFALSLPAEDIAPLRRTPVRAGPGHFQLVGTNLPVAGEWKLTVTADVDRFTQEQGSVTFRIR